MSSNQLASIQQFKELYSSSPTESPPSGGGKIALRKVKSFYFDKDVLNVVSKVGEFSKAVFTITNNGTEKLDFIISVSKLEDYVTIPTRIFSLEHGKSLKIETIVIAPKEPKVYTTSIIVEADGIVQELPIIINVETAEKLFDVELEIVHPKNKQIKPGEDITARVEIFSLKDTGAVDVILSYILKDQNNNVIINESSAIAVDIRTSIFKDIHIPDYLRPGKYVLVAEVRYKGMVTSASSVITVVGKVVTTSAITDIERLKRNYILIVIIAIFIITLLIIFISYIRKNKYLLEKIRAKIKYKLKNILKIIHNKIQEFQKRRAYRKMASGMKGVKKIQKDILKMQQALVKKEKDILKLQEIEKRKTYLKSLALKEKGLKREIQKLKGKRKRKK
ncbi:hypothetical protein HYV49_00630 [Candidatus Pacearchaeota archaeon]|nr:hypothetical protein [Candidatus Pacearchaeota archaeon]